MKSEISCRSTVSTAFARKPRLTVYRAHSGSSPAGGKTTQIMTKIIWAMATLQSTITLNLTIGSRNPFVRTFICIRVWYMPSLSSGVFDLREPLLRQGHVSWPTILRIFGFSKFSVLSPDFGLLFTGIIINARLMSLNA